MSDQTGSKFIVSGIGTDVGKTAASAVLCLALNAKYWKPVQAGDLENSDTIKICRLTNGKIETFPEAYLLTQSMSPHAAADIDGLTIDLDQLQIPETKGNLIIEGAGGLMVPLNHSDLYIDWIQKTKDRIASQR